MAHRNLFAAAALSFAACQGATGGDPTGNSGTLAPNGLEVGSTVNAIEVLPPSESLDYLVGARLAEIQSDAGGNGGLLDRVVWDTAVNTAVSSFQEPLAGDLNIPLGALQGALGVGLEVQPDGSLEAEAEADINGEARNIRVALIPNADLSGGQAQIFVDEVLRLDISTDFAFTDVALTVFDEAGTAVKSAEFSRTGADFNLLVTDLQDQDKFALALAAQVLSIELDKDGDGFGNNNGEFQLNVNTAAFEGDFTLVVPILGGVKACFGGGQLVSVLCD
jgi:hypothetical protein